MANSSVVRKVPYSKPLKKVFKSASEKAIEYIGNASRIRVQDLRDNPGARTAGRQVTSKHNQAGHTIGELQHAAKPPIGWVWGDFYKPWHRMFPGDYKFNGDINLRREYVPLSLIELQRMIDLGWLDTDKLIDVSALCSTQLVKIKPELRQFGIHLMDQGDDIFCAKINIEVQWASLHTIAAIERAGGRIRTAYYDLESLKAAANPEAWFRAGKPIPRRKYPPHSLMEYYQDPNRRGYLADPQRIEDSRKRLAGIIQYELPDQNPNIESKRPEQVFLGLESGQLVSLADKKVYEPTNPTLVGYYRTDEQLSDINR